MAQGKIEPFKIEVSDEMLAVDLAQT